MPAVWTCTIAKMPVYAYRYDNYRQDAGAKGLSKRGPSVGSIIMKMYRGVVMHSEFFGKARPCKNVGLHGTANDMPYVDRIFANLFQVFTCCKGVR